MARMTSWREWTSSPSGAALSAVLAAVAAVTLAMLAAPGMDRPRENDSASLVEQEGFKSRAYYAMAWRGARAVRMRDSLRAFAGRGVSFKFDARIPSDSLRLAESRLRAAWASFQVDTPRVPVVLVLTAAAKRSAAHPIDDPAFVALPLSRGEPCVVALRILYSWRSVARDARFLRRDMFGCALMAQYGYPGAGVRGELRRIGWNPTQLSFNRRYFQFSSTGNTLGAMGPWFPEAGIAYVACSAGVRESCAKVAGQTSNRIRENAPGISRTARFLSDLSLLAFLRASLPARDFERLWRDDRPFPAAVASITGQPIEEWTHTAILRTGPPLESSFAPTLPIFGRALLFLTLAIVVGIAVQTRRRVS